MTETRFPTGISGKKNDDLDIWSDSDIALYPQGHIWISQGTKLIFEGTIPDDYEIKLQATSATADRDIILPDYSGTLTLNEKLQDGSFDLDVASIEFGPSNGYSILVDEAGDLYLIGSSTDNDVIIRTNSSGLGQYDFNFGIDGVLTLPGGGNIDAAASITLKAYYGPPGSHHAWQFDGASGTVRKTTSGYMDIGGLSGVKLTATGATTKIWTFDGDGNLVAPGNITGNILKINDGVHEVLTIRAGDGGGFTSDFDCSTGYISYCTSVSGNWTANFTNLNLAEGYATVLTIVIEQSTISGTPGYPSAVQIEGSPKTLIWQGNTPPTPTNNGIDVVTFSILRTGISGNEYVVLGQMTGF